MKLLRNLSLISFPVQAFVSLHSKEISYNFDINVQ